MSSTSSSPCAACKFLRRKCTAECVFAPYFPPDEPQKFANVHKIFGASNITKLLNELPRHKREDAVNSLAYEANSRVKDPVYGCVGVISILQRQVLQLRKELAIVRSDLARYTSVGITGPQYALPTGPAAASAIGISMVFPGATTREQLLEFAQDQNPTREKLLEYARIGSGGLLDINTSAAVGFTGAFHGQLQPYPHVRPGSGSASNGEGTGGSHTGHTSSS